MEAVALLAGEPKTDRPQCVCRVLSDFGRRFNDMLGEGDHGDMRRGIYLAPLAPLLVNTRSTKAVENERARVIILGLVRDILPMVDGFAGGAALDQLDSGSDVDCIIDSLGQVVFTCTGIAYTAVCSLTRIAKWLKSSCLEIDMAAAWVRLAANTYTSTPPDEVFSKAAGIFRRAIEVREVVP
jgi:hypothetical protein